MLTRVLALVLALTAISRAYPQGLENELQQVPLAQLAADARALGDAARGAVVFYQPQMACSKCHATGTDNANPLGPDLTTIEKETTDQSIIESLLLPSKTIRKGFESVSILTGDGQTISAIVVERTADKLVYRDVASAGRQATLLAQEIEQVKTNQLSIMPAGQLNQLNSRQQFYDLVRYLMEIRDGGKSRAQALQPSPALLAFKIPEYESHLDHAGLIAAWNDEAYQRGEAIYKRVCGNCHGTRAQPGSLPTSLRFAEGKFKNGSDPLSMYRTLTHGFGQMAPQAWMVPSQKYDVIHYIRQAYLREHNRAQWVELSDAYLASLPKGDTRGPEPSNIEPWSTMDYGSSLVHTYQVPGDKSNFAYKGIAIRLDPGPGGVSRGNQWMVFDTDTLRAAAGWTNQAAPKQANNFIDWRSIQFNGEHGIHPTIVGRIAFANSTGPGWGSPGGPSDNTFKDDQRVLGRDGKRYGPLPRDWGQFKGMYYHGQNVIIRYTVGHTEILELPRLHQPDRGAPLLFRTFNIGPREHELILQVAEVPAPAVVAPSGQATMLIATLDETKSAGAQPLQFDGATYLEVEDAQRLNIHNQDFSISARIKTKADGTIFSFSDGGDKWIPNGQSLFVRGGKLGFDIGWVGAVAGRRRIDDDQWHSVAMTWQQATGRVQLFVDGKLDGESKLKAKARIAKQVARIGFTSSNFPQHSFFQGELSEVSFYQQLLADKDTKRIDTQELRSKATANWLLSAVNGTVVQDQTSSGLDATVHRGATDRHVASAPVAVGFAPSDTSASWSFDDGNLRLHIPPGQQPLKFSVWIPTTSETDADLLSSETRNVDPDTGLVRASGGIPSLDGTVADLDLSKLTSGGPARWPQVLTTEVARGTSNGPFAVDTLTPPAANPWFALTRFTGLDFYADGRMAVCTWDGDVWIATPRREAEKEWLDWRRIASGLFQPLGLKIIHDKIHVICRDQLAVLHDLNGDGETDYYQCLNNDHQVTEHFHEFAMGLQTDAAGNFYYAKSGCHGKAAVVPHHGTLLRVSADGSRTDILANGFRAANGVCLNPDGSFVVTDQEGFWNPKNRINWVTLSESGRPNFYGNMLGYHDVTDTSDSAMTPPLCWITNAFDRSPAELLWVDSPRWGTLHGSLLNLSYGYGKVFLVPHEKVDGMMQGGMMQGGMIALSLPAFPTGIMRGRFHPTDGQLYTCGMFAWAGNATEPGGLYRIRYTDQPLHLPLRLKAYTWGMELTFTEPLDASSAKDPSRYAIEAWDLKRTAKYGSDHYNQRRWEVTSAELSSDGKTLRLTIPDIAPTWGMEIKYNLQSADGQPFEGKIHNTVHRLQ